MKHFSFLRIFFFLVIMPLYTGALAQDYVITTKGDTLTGKVKPLNFGPDRKVQVTDATKKKSVISILQTRAFSLKGEIYNPVRSDKGYVFMQLKKEGYLSLYAFQLENQTTYEGSYLLKKDGQGIEVPNLSFKKMLTKFLGDCPQVADKIETGKLGKKDLDAIIDEYNMCIDRKSQAQQTAIAQRVEQTKGLATWTALEDKINAEKDFEGKSNALDMVHEIENKIKNNQKIPNFLTEGLKSALTETSLKADLEKALSELN